MLYFSSGRLFGDGVRVSFRFRRRSFLIVVVAPDHGGSEAAMTGVFKGQARHDII